MDIWLQAAKMVLKDYWWAILLVLAVVVANLIDNLLQAQAQRRARFTKDELTAAKMAQAKARYRTEIQRLI